MNREITLRIKISEGEYPELFRKLTEETNQMRRTRLLVSHANRHLMLANGAAPNDPMSKPIPDEQAVAPKQFKQLPAKAPAVSNRPVRSLPAHHNFRDYGGTD